MNGIDLDPRRLEALVAGWASPGEPLHPLPLRSMVLQAEALETVPELLEAEGYRRVLMVTDATPKVRAGESAHGAVLARLQAASAARHLVLAEPLHADLPTATALVDELDGLDLVVAVGSGSVTDLVKYARHLRVEATGRPLPMLSIPTAPSVTAYSSALSVLMVDGVKRTLPTAPPDHVVADGELLAGAPRAMVLAGFGDVIARSVSYGDWFLAGQLGMAEGYSEVPGRLLEPSETRMIAAAAGLAKGETGAVMQVTEALLLAGLAMSVVNQTSPLSGWEHVISHFLDMTADHDGRAPAFHGEQVGVATLLAARAYERALPNLDPDRLLWQPDATEADRLLQRIGREFGPYDPSGRMAAEIGRDAARKLSLWQATGARHEAVRDAWSAGTIATELARLTRPAAAIEAALTTAGAPTRFDDMTHPVSRDTAHAALRLGHLIRSRFTLGDLLEISGWMSPENLAGLLEG